MTRASAAAAAAALLAALAGGCEKSDRLAVHKTHGKLVRPGPPVAGLGVTFHPADPSAPSAGINPTGVVNPDGTFAVTTYNRHDGAPAGEYVVTVDEAPRDPSQPRPALPPAKYRDARTSPLRATVAAQPVNDLEPFVLTP